MPFTKIDAKIIEHISIKKLAGRSTNVWLENNLESIEQKGSPSHKIANTSTHALKLPKLYTMESKMVQKMVINLKG